MDILITIIAALISAEFIGYWLHVLLHSNKIEFLSKNHMIHHLISYGPKQRFRTEEYVTSLIDGRPGIFNVGLEWLAPITLVLIGLGLILWLLQVPLDLAILFLSLGMVWNFITFNYMHDSMHLEHFWMAKNPLLSKWFQKARERHEIHHLEIDDSGKMVRNFGICFFFFDRIFGTSETKFNQFNENGYDKAKSRYAYIFEKIKD